MANANDVALLREYTDEPDNTYYSDAVLSGIIDAQGGVVGAAAYEIWTRKAARYSSLVNISEGGSTRANGSLLTNALAMQKAFSSYVASELTDAPRRATIRKIVRT